MMLRNFSLSLLILLGSCGGTQEPVATDGATAPQKIYEWRMVTTWPKNLPGMGIAPETMAKKIKTMSNGRLDIKVYGAGEIVPALEVFEAVSQGTVQMAGWFNKEINSLEDLKGMKMRIPGLGGEVFSRAGGTAINLPGGEIFTSMQTGVIDATEWVGPYNDLAFGLHQVAKYYYYPGWQEPGPSLELIINKEAWDELPLDLKAIVENASLAVNADLLAEYTARNNAALLELVDVHGVELRQLPADVLSGIRDISYAMTAEIVDPNDELANRIYNSYKTYRESVVSYHEISERAYINARAAQ